MGRFEKLNDDIQALADKIIADQDLCKLIYYPDNNPLDQPDINGKKYVLKNPDPNQIRLLLFKHKIPLAANEGTYVLIRPTKIRPTGEGEFTTSLLCFDVYCHEEGVRDIYYTDKKGNSKKGDRAILIIDRIDEFMQNANLSIGENNFVIAEPIENRDAKFTGFGIAYKDVDFRQQEV